MTPLTRTRIAALVLIGLVLLGLAYVKLATAEETVSVPKGALVLVSPYVAGRDPRYWQEPAEFIPERWESQSVKEAGQKNIYFPFGGGVRRCIGESFAWTEAILLLATIAQRWTFKPVTVPKLEPRITLRPLNFCARAERR